MKLISLETTRLQHRFTPITSPFGSVMPTRAWSDANREYRYGFNGKEKDKEGMGGGGSTYDYGFRIYNSSLGRFLSIDPLFRTFPWYTPFQFSGNKPISSIDIDGKEEQSVNPNSSSTDPNDNAQESCKNTNLNSTDEEINSQNVSANESTNGNATDCASDNTSIQVGDMVGDRKVKAAGPTQVTQTTTHTFKYDEGYTGVAVGNDIITTTISKTQHIAYDDGSFAYINTYIIYTAIINEQGQLEGGINVSYSSNYGGVNSTPYSLNSTIDLASAPSDFRAVYNEANRYKNATATKQTSFIQTIAWNNRKGMKFSSTVVDGVTTGLSYMGKYGESAANVIAFGFKAYEFFTRRTNSDDPLDIIISITKSYTE